MKYDFRPKQSATSTPPKPGKWSGPGVSHGPRNGGGGDSHTAKTVKRRAR